MLQQSWICLCLLLSIFPYFVLSFLLRAREMSVFKGRRLLMFRSSHQRCSIRKGIPENFTKFTGKHLCQSLFFNKVAGLRPVTLLNKKTLAQVLFCEFCEFLRTPILQNTSRRLLLDVTLNLVYFLSCNCNRICYSTFESFTCLLQPSRSADNVTRRIEKPCFSLPTENVKYTGANRGVAKTLSNI